MMTPPFLENSTPLARKLASRIAAAGPIPVHDYIEACLYDAEHGYYRKQSGIGRGGDFITAPEISQVFGELTGLWAGESWRLMGAPQTLRLVELGPGRGTLMADALRALRVCPGFVDCATVHLVESSPVLTDIQKAALGAAPCPILWHKRVEDVPHGPTVLIANEFLDCLPVRQLVFDAKAQAWRERLVGFKGGQFAFEQGQAAQAASIPETLEIEDGAVLERRPAIPFLLDVLAKRASAAPFAGLFIDYGYAKPSLGETVQAVRRHAFADLFEAPGETDITAHTDFHEFGVEAVARGLTVSGPMPMGEWLLRLGLEARVQQLVRNLPGDAALDVRRRVARLVDPAQMGVLFKTVLLTGGGMPVPPPFATA